MKRIIIAIVLLQSIIGFSQEKKLKNGIYSAYNSDKILNVLIQDEKLFLYVVPFEYSIKNDSILTINNQQPLGFSLTYSFDKTLDSNKIKVNIINYLLATDDIFIATEAEKIKSEYKSLSAIRANLAIDGNMGEPTDLTSFNIEKTKNITLVKEDNYQKTGEVATFEIPDTANVINIEYLDKNVLMNLSGVFNESTNYLTLYNDAKEPMKFKYNKESGLAKVIKPKETVIKKNWTFPGKVPKYATVYTDMAVDSTAVKIEGEQTHNYSFYRGKNFNNALKNVSKSVDKFLIVSFDLKNNNRQSEFDEYLKTLESDYNNLGLSAASADRYDYYLATEKDKNLLSKYKTAPDSKVLIFNNSGELVYSTTNDLTNLNSFFDRNNISDKDFIDADKKIKFDALFSKKAITNIEILRALKNPFTIDYPEEVAQDEPVKKTDLENNQQELSNIKNDTISKIKFYTAVNDEMTNAKKGFYQLKSTLQTVNQKWEKIVADFEKSNKIDEDYITVVKQQLNDEGFSKKIFGKSSFKIEDYRMLNYVFANYKTLIKETEPKENPATTNEAIDNAAKAVEEAARIAAAAAVESIKSFDNQENQGINDVLDNYFSRFANEIDINDKNIKNQKNIKFLLFEYYKKYVKLTDYKTSVVKDYMKVLNNNLTDTEMQKEYFEIFEIYFNKMIAPNKSIIESLDANYTENDEEYWTSYKNNFANDCNQTAWEIVKKSTDKSLIQKAIKWSETSNELDKKNHFYSDTLARLYYLNGQKEKAIATQQKAFDLGKDSENGGDYKMVLEQMKTGTYIYSEPKQ